MNPEFPVVDVHAHCLPADWAQLMRWEQSEPGPESQSQTITFLDPTRPEPKIRPDAQSL